MKHLLPVVVGVLVAGLCGGCAPSVFKRTYVPHEAGRQYASIDEDEVKVVELPMREPDEVYEESYPDAALIGEARFEGPAGSREAAASFAASVGADVVLWHKAWVATTVDRYAQPRPRYTTSTVRTAGGDVVAVPNRETDIGQTAHVRQLYRHHVLYLRTK